MLHMDEKKHLPHTSEVEAARKSVQSAPPLWKVDDSFLFESGKINVTELDKYARWHTGKALSVNTGSSKAQDLTAKLFDEPLAPLPSIESRDHLSAEEELSNSSELYWECNKCIFKNKESLLECEMCKALRPSRRLSSTWTCLMCTFEDNSNLDDPICLLCNSLPHIDKTEGIISVRPKETSSLSERLEINTSSQTCGNSQASLTGVNRNAYTASTELNESFSPNESIISLPDVEHTNADSKTSDIIEEERTTTKPSSPSPLPLTTKLTPPPLPSIPSPVRKSTEITLSIGDQVRIKGLYTMQEFNGREGYIAGEKDFRDRHLVYLMNAVKVTCKVSNCEVIRSVNDWAQEDIAGNPILRAVLNIRRAAKKKEEGKSNSSSRLKRMFSRKRESPMTLNMKSSMLCRVSRDRETSPGPEADDKQSGKNESNQIKKKLDQLTEQTALLKYFRDCITAVRESRKAHINDLKSSQKQLKRCEQRKKVELERWQAYAQYDVLSLGRNFFENKLLWLSNRRAILALHVEIFSTRWKLLLKADEQLKQKRKDFTDEDIRQLVETAIYAASQIQFPARLKEMEGNTAALAQVVQEVKDRYDKIREETMSAEITIDERKIAIKEFLDQVMENSWNLDSLYRHKSDVANILRFEQYLLDQRQFEGKIISQWRSLVEKPREQFSLDVVATFLERLGHTFCVNHELDPERYFDTVRLLVCRVLFPKIYDFLIKLVSADIRANDKVYSEKADWLRLVTESALGIEQKFCRRKIAEVSDCSVKEIAAEVEKNQKSQLGKEKEEQNKPKEGLLTPHSPYIEIEFENLYHLTEEKRNQEFPYGHAIYIMHQIRTELVPDDQVDYLHRAIRAIQAASQTYSNEEKPLNADTLFPILIFVILHSRLGNVFLLASFFDAFLPEQAAFRGQTGFCLSLFKAAISFVKGQDSKKYNRSTVQL